MKLRKNLLALIFAVLLVFSVSSLAFAHQPMEPCTDGNPCNYVYAGTASVHIGGGYYVQGDLYICWGCMGSFVL